MPEKNTRTVVSSELQQVVLRCGCSDEQKHSPDFHAKHDRPCPNPRAFEQLGTVAAFYRNPIRRFFWRLSRLLRGQKPGTAAVH